MYEIYTQLFENNKEYIIYNIEPKKENNIKIGSVTIKTKRDFENKDKFLLLKKQGLTMIDITALDFIEKKTRYTVLYILRHLKRIYLVYLLMPYTKKLLTASEEFKMAAPAEQEVFDMFGLFFRDHKNLRRILTDYSFKGKPLKKDYPITGYKEIVYSISNKVIIHKNIDLKQEFRVFFPLLSWIEECSRKLNTAIRY